MACPRISSVCPLGRRVAREEGGQKGGGRRVAACQGSIFTCMLVKPAGEISVWEHLEECGYSGATCQLPAPPAPHPLVLPFSNSLCPLATAMGVTLTVFPHLFGASFLSPSLELGLIFVLCAHLMARPSHEWIVVCPLLAPRAPVETVLCYLIHDSSLVTLFPFFYC